MIQIERSPCPAVLIDADADSDKYRHQAVVSELWSMQGEKCCYCEQKIPEKGHAKAVEHFAPQSVFEAQRNHWPNLLLACSQCNGKKSDKFPVMLTYNVDEVKLIYVKKTNKEDVDKEAPALIDPSGETNPEAHFTYRTDLENDGPLVGQMYPRQGSVQGEATISIIGLDQPFFHGRRRSHFINLVNTFMQLIEANDENRRKTLLLQFEGFMSRGGEFAGLAREFARKYRLDVEYDLVIPDIT